MAYPETFSTMRDLIEQKLQDTSNAVFSTTEIDLAITEGLREFGNLYKPYIYKAEFNLESRTGTATSTTSGALVDATNDQFLAADVGKWIYNETDRTWAEVTAYVSAEQLTLSKNIMASGEEYRMFNKGCTDSKEINFRATQQADGALGSRCIDYLYIDKIEYPILQDPPRILKRGDWEEQENGILHLNIDDEPEDTSDSDAADEVWIYFATQHWLSKLTTLLGKVNNGAGYSAGDVAMNIDDMTAADVILKGQMFRIDGVRGIYVADYQRALDGAGTCTLSFFPPLSDAVANDVTVRFISNTLDYKMEGLLADLVAGKTAMNKASYYINRVNVGGGEVRRFWYNWGKDKYASAKMEIEGLHGFVAPSITLP